MSHRIDHITFEGSDMLFKSNGRKYRVRTDAISARLGRADLASKQLIRISPDGYSISWPKLQLQLTVSGLFQMCQSMSY